MRSVLRKGIKEFLKAEGRLRAETLGPGEARAPRSGKGAAILEEVLKQARRSQVRDQRICMTLLVLVSTAQVLLAVYGLGSKNLPVVLASGIGLLPLPIIWVLRRIGWEGLLTNLIGSFLDVLPSKEAGRIIEIIYRVCFGGPLNVEDEEPNIPILFVSSDPSDMAQLRLGREAREIQKELRAARLRHRFVLHQWTAATPEDLLQAMLDTQPEIVQFSGHGRDDGALCFEDAQGRIQPVEPATLAALFREFGDVQCVLLNACYAALQADAIAEHIEHVIGAPDIIEDGAAIAFAVGFYKSLGAGCLIQEAYRLGCVELELRGFPREAAPILVRRNRPAERSAEAS